MGIYDCRSITLKNTKDPKNKINKLKNPVISKRQMAKEAGEKVDAKISYLDERYKLVVKMVINEINKRNIDINSKDSFEKVESIIEEILQVNIFKNRFNKIDELHEVLNAVKRYVNKSRIEGPSLDE